MLFRNAHSRALVSLLAGSMVPGLALAQDGFSTDIELVRPSFAPRATTGVDSPFVGAEGTFGFGAQLQYQRDPLRLIEFDTVRGSVVRHRVVGQVGASWAASDRIALRGWVPLVTQWGSEIDDLSGDGTGMGDLTGGVKYQFWEGQGFTLAAHGDLILNVGARNRYMGESQPRTNFGFLGGFEAEPVLIMTNVGIITRSELDTERDFTLGNELMWNSAVVVDLPGDRTAITAEVLGHYGLSKLFQGGAESSMEWTAGVQYAVTERWRLDVGVGRGMTAGYGTSTYRGMVGLRYQVSPKEEVDEPDFFVDIINIPDDEPDPVEPPPDPPEDPPDPDEWREGELAKQIEDRIVIRDPIQFEFATARLLPESLPTLRQVAGLVNRDARIGHLLIEGHASEEGSFAYNYDLSIRRAKAIFEQLLVLGVHPERMSYRGMGEVVPIAEGSDEASLERNRRVEFEIIKQYAPGDETPEYETSLKLPWSGEPATVSVPPPLPEPVKPPTDLLHETPTDMLEDDPAEAPPVEPSPADPTDAGTEPAASEEP